VRLQPALPLPPALPPPAPPPRLAPPPLASCGRPPSPRRSLGRRKTSGPWQPPCWHRAAVAIYWSTLCWAYASYQGPYGRPAIDFGNRMLSTTGAQAIFSFESLPLSLWHPRALSPPPSSDTFSHSFSLTLFRSVPSSLLSSPYPSSILSLHIFFLLYIHV
jgi:hypothetical protein